jgi:hypothetical protein
MATSRVTIADIVQGVRAKMETVLGSTKSQALRTITEGVNDLPTIQTYFESLEQDPGGNTDRSTFGAGVRQTRVTVHVDVYGRQRSHIGEDMETLTNLVDGVVDVLEQEEKKPYFGIRGVKAYEWSAERVTFVYGDVETRYAGTRFIVDFRIF